MTDPITANGRAIRRYRILAGWKSTPFAKEVGISHSHLAHIEAGRNRPSPPVLKRMAGVLERPVEDLVIEAPVPA